MPDHIATYCRVFRASHESWVRCEIDKLIDAIPSQPEFANDPLRTGEVMVLIRLVPPSTPATQFAHDVTRGI